MATGSRDDLHGPALIDEYPEIVESPEFDANLDGTDTTIDMDELVGPAVRSSAEEVIPETFISDQETLQEQQLRGAAADPAFQGCIEPNSVEAALLNGTWFDFAQLETAETLQNDADAMPGVQLPGAADALKDSAAETLKKDENAMSELDELDIPGAAFALLDAAEEEIPGTLRYHDEDAAVFDEQPAECQIPGADLALLDAAEEESPETLRDRDEDAALFEEQLDEFQFPGPDFALLDAAEESEEIPETLRDHDEDAALFQVQLPGPAASALTNSAEEDVPERRINEEDAMSQQQLPGAPEDADLVLRDVLPEQLAAGEAEASRIEIGAKVGQRVRLNNGCLLQRLCRMMRLSRVWRQRNLKVLGSFPVIRSSRFLRLTDARCCWRHGASPCRPGGSGTRFGQICNVSRDHVCSRLILV